MYKKKSSALRWMRQMTIFVNNSKVQSHELLLVYGIRGYMKISRKRIHSLHSVDYTIDLKRALKHLIVSNPSTLFRKKV